jgi:hypothetical protein
LLALWVGAIAPHYKRSVVKKFVVVAFLALTSCKAEEAKPAEAAVEAPKPAEAPKAEAPKPVEAVEAPKPIEAPKAEEPKAAAPAAK